MSQPRRERNKKSAQAVLVIGLAIAAVCLALLFRHYSVTSSLLCLLAVTSIAQTYGVWAGLAVTTLCSQLLFWVIYPLNPYLVSSVSTSAFVLTSAVFCALQGRLPAAQRGEERALTLVSLSRQLSQADDEAEAWQALSHHLETEFGPHQLEVGEPSKNSSPTLFWFPLPENLGRVGLETPPEEKPHLEAFLLYTAQTISHLRLSHKVQEAELVQAREKLYHALLDSISHDLRIPLVSITGVLSSLLDESLPVPAATRQDMLENALSESERLRRLVDNLLQMTRLEAGVLKVSKKPYDMGEVLAAVLDSLGPQLAGRSVELEVPDDLPLVPQDPILIGQVVRNLLDNALKYSPPGSPLRLEASFVDESQVRVSIWDQGRGIAPGEEQKVLEKFYRGRNQQTHGSGLGLSICDGLIAAHGGELTIAARPNGGTEASFVLPVTQVGQVNP